MAWSSGGVELNLRDYFEPHQVDCEGFLSLSRGSSRIGYSSEAHGVKDPYLVNGCATPAEGSTLDS
jgi:hypothetical protein